MNTILLQNKIDSLQNAASSLLQVDLSTIHLYIDDLTRLNNEIYEKINILFPLRGTTVEQEASLCLAILSGYSVIMYANPEDEIKKQTVLERARKIMGETLPASLKHHLLTICGEL